MLQQIVAGAAIVVCQIIVITLSLVEQRPNEAAVIAMQLAILTLNE